jgi:hypothetical protein
MNQFDQLLIEARARDLSLELERERQRSLASAGAKTERGPVRLALGSLLVRAGLWIDPRASERVSGSQPEPAPALSPRSR